MSTQSIINTGKVLHQLVIGQVQGISESLFDITPEGFRNTIRWNVGHIVFWLDRYQQMSFGSPSAVPAAYETLFNSGTKPADWTIAPPSKEELVQQLSSQLAQISEITPELLDQDLNSPFVLGPFEFKTAAELFNFALMHEAIHLGTITSQQKAVQE
ncbi:DinB family protein [Paenibacillus sp. XY044]|uniref:DinB family protein n=1 Tax=Paenibacillus sp. XY044 TaxID=2026089 RepID=UPI000B99BAC3|nr:DinB family protein [Paenibacillus sp. XY044]OZB98723.1 hypothetical protein CJP46_06185 [Paenibacillus sp. XY044]